jgi:hypothetical protein
MATLSLNKAESAFRRTKKTIKKDLEDGTLSGNKNARGHWEIEESELARVYGVRTETLGEHPQGTPQAPNPDTIENRIEIERLRGELKSAQQLTDAMSDQVTDLRTRLDKEGEERRQLTAMLTDQRAGQGNTTRWVLWPFKKKEKIFPTA